jgi:putative protease
MFDHLAALEDAGVDSVKIEGRMKSLYYTAVVTRSYRRALDQLEGREGKEERSSAPALDPGHGLTLDLAPYREELFKISRREFSTGFYFGRRDADETTSKSYLRQYIFNGTIGRALPDGRHSLDVKNQIRIAVPIEYIGPDILYIEDPDFTLYDENGRPVEKADHGKSYTIRTSVPVQPGYIIRTAVDR